VQVNKEYIAVSLWDSNWISWIFKATQTFRF